MDEPNPKCDTPGCFKDGCLKDRHGLWRCGDNVREFITEAAVEDDES